MSFSHERITAQPVPATARQYLVRMRDGVRLATDVYLPDDVEDGTDDTALPTVLIRLPYDKNSRYVYFEKVAAMFTARGYAMVVQDVRGKFRSGGTTLPWTGEVDDGYDSIEWITQQGWSNGLVGMFGDSYYGFTQWSAVASQHPALRAIVPRMTSAQITPGRLAVPHGAGRRVPWLEAAGYHAMYWVDNDTYEYVPDFSKRPLIDAFEEAFAAIGKRPAAFDLEIAGIELDSYNAVHPYDARPIPVLHCVGWFDNLGAAHMQDYTELSKRPSWAAIQYLHADATDHENYHLDKAPVTPADDHAANDTALDALLPKYSGPALDFFDVFLKGSASLDTLPRVRWMLGHEGWRTSQSWPPPEARTRTLFLADPESAIGVAPGGSLAEEPTAGEAAVQWRYDPDALVPSTVSDTFAFLRDYPDERVIADRDDVLLFTGSAQSAPLDLAGPVDVFLDVASTAPTFDVFVKLLDVAPDDSTRMIMRGDLQPDGPGQIQLHLGHTGYRLRTGHRLAVLIASSDFPLYVPNSGTTENPWLTVAPKPSTQTLRTGVLARSHIRLTVLPDAPQQADF